MATRLFSVPADFRQSTIDSYYELNLRYDNATVEETYGQITGRLLTGSGRGSCKLPEADLESPSNYISYSAKRGIGFNYTFNASCLGNIEFTKAGFSLINRFLGSLWDAGVRRLTITLPQLIMLVRESGYPFDIKLSTICQVNSASKAKFWKKQGIDKIVIDEDITRNFRVIKQISSIVGDGVEMIVNSACLRDCPYKMLHYNHEAHFPVVHQDERRFYERRCFINKADDWTIPIKLNWVRPEDLGYYESIGVRRFKIQGRHAVLEGDPLKTVEAYMRGSYSGDLYALINMFFPYIAENTYHP
ncbi:MAG: U32 family peptidase, partial [Armatimonadota bacterium]|nr:U32 family peptidase [Armatimonadota bacterium]